MSAKTVLVTGATGQQGGAVARLLLAKGHNVRALVRNPASANAVALADAGATLIPGAMDDRSALGGAVQGVDAVFAVTTPFEAGMEAEVLQGTTVADAVAPTGAHLVFTSVAWAWARTGIPHFESKWEIEKHIRALEIPHTILGPVYFMENAIAPWSMDALRAGTVAVPLGADVPQAMIAMDDIAAFAVLAIEDPERMKGRRVDIAGDIVTGPQTAEIISAASGKPVSYYPVPVEAVRAQSEDLAIMFDYYEKNRPTVDLESLRSEYPEIVWTSYRQWASTRDWAKILA